VLVTEISSGINGKATQVNVFFANKFYGALSCFATVQVWLIAISGQICGSYFE
jgi:hypothetical protein